MFAAAEGKFYKIQEKADFLVAHKVMKLRTVTLSSGQLLVQVQVPSYCNNNL